MGSSLPWALGPLSWALYHILGHSGWCGKRVLAEARRGSVSPPLTGVSYPEQVGLEGPARPTVSLGGSQGPRPPTSNENECGKG